MPNKEKSWWMFQPVIGRHKEIMDHPVMEQNGWGSRY
jgi:hypothetical protein